MSYSWDPCLCARLFVPACCVSLARMETSSFSSSSVSARAHYADDAGHGDAESVKLHHLVSLRGSLWFLVSPHPEELLHPPDISSYPPRCGCGAPISPPLRPRRALSYHPSAPPFFSSSGPVSHSQLNLRSSSSPPSSSLLGVPRPR